MGVRHAESTQHFLAGFHHLRRAAEVEFDGAARIVDPIIDGINTGTHVWGKFLKDYVPVDW